MVKNKKSASVLHYGKNTTLCRNPVIAVLMKNEKFLAYCCVAAISFLWGTTFLGIKIGVEDFPGFLLAGIRQAAAGLIVILVCVARGVKWPGWKTTLKLSGLGILIIGMGNGPVTWAEEHVESGMAAIVCALVPIWISLFSVMLLQQRSPGWKQVAGLLIGFSGIVLVFSDSLGQFANPGYLWGVIFTAIGTFCWGLGSVLSRRNPPKTDLFFGAGIQMAAAGFVLIAVHAFTGKEFDFAQVGWKSWTALGYLILFGSIIAFYCYLYAFSKLPPVLVSVYAYINPLVAVALGALWLQEPLSWRVIAGTLVTVGGVYLVSRSSAPKKEPAGNIAAEATQT
ncbi:MAG: hypothetical protein FD123_3710 [Bacteroidetes bacterium]|nr:MAG: hypothetical protein FD123_3710 [Bacteroidota bacterium]